MGWHLSDPADVSGMVDGCRQQDGTAGSPAGAPGLPRSSLR